MSDIDKDAFEKLLEDGKIYGTNRWESKVIIDGLRKQLAAHKEVVEAARKSVADYNNDDLNDSMALDNIASYLESALSKLKEME